MWDWGTWDLAEADDPLDAVEAGNLHFDLHGEKLRGRFVLVRRGRGGAGRSAKPEWLLLHKHDDDAVAGWDPEDYPRSVKTGRTNDEVKAAPAATWRSDTIWTAPTTDELAALDALGNGGMWSFGGREREADQPRQGAVPGDERRSAALTKRDLIRHDATLAPAILPYLAGRPVNLHRFPNGVDHPGYWHRSAPKHTPDWIDTFHHPDAKPGEAQDYLVLDSPPALVWAANFNAIELHPWISTVAHPHHPTWAMIDIDPGGSSSFDDVLTLARLHRTALEHLGVQGMPKVTGKRGIQIWVPVADGTTFDETRAWVEQLSRAVGRDGARPGDLGVEGGRARRQGAPGLHAERDQQDARRPVHRPPGTRRAGDRADHLGRARRSGPAARPVDDRHHRRAPGRRRRPAGPADRAAAAPARRSTADSRHGNRGPPTVLALATAGTRLA